MKTTISGRMVEWRWVAGTSRLGVEYVSGLPVYWLDAWDTVGAEVVSHWRAAAWFARFGAGLWVPSDLAAKVQIINDPIGR